MGDLTRPGAAARWFATVACAALLLTGAGARGGAGQTPTVTLDPDEVPLYNGGFELGLEGWTVPRDEGMSQVSTEQVRTGGHSLKVTDADDKRGSDAVSVATPVGGARVIDLKGYVRPVSGSGLGIYVRLRDREGRQIGGNDDYHRTAPSAPVGQWVPFSLTVYTTPETASFEVWLHSYGAAKVTAYVDDLTLVDRGAPSAARPWEPQYKLKPGGPLTAADVVGPDGIVYPDWTYAGVPGGIPAAVAVRARAAEFGARPDDGRDDADALERAAESVGAKGGGALLLAPGTYHLDRPVSIHRDGVVLRGAGADRTRLVFRYAGPKQGVGFFAPKPGATVGAGTWIEVHAAPKDLREIAIVAGGKVVAKTTYYPQHWGGTFSLRTGGAQILGAVAADGPTRLRAVATYADGTVRTSDLPVTLSRKSSANAPGARVPSQIAAIMFTGVSQGGAERKLAKDGRRGDTSLTLESAAGLRIGDRIRLRAPATPRWNALVRNACPWGEYRRYEFLVTGVSGNVVSLNQPLRIDFPVVDGSYVAAITPIRRCGVEYLTLAQTREVWTSGIVFSNAWECWAKGVTVEKAGRFPLYFLNAKWCEMRDCTLADAWYKGGGGTAYAGWEYASDCLMDHITTLDLRHAPVVQWAASGNVIRRSTFLNSDGQWHSGWTNENLFEDCVIVSKNGRANGGYGYGLWASPPEDEAHGPNGPRNVVYNCDVTSDRAGMWLGGMNEGWIIAYNRFAVASGPAFQAKTASFDHILRNNVFVLADAARPAVVLATPDCVGIEATGNRVFGGNGRFATGAGTLLLDRDNVVAAAAGIAPERPQVGSIFDWQRAAKARRANAQRKP